LPKKSAFWVLSKQPQEIGHFGKRRVPAHFKTFEEAKRYCQELNLRKGVYHPGYYIEERIGDKPVAAKKQAGDADESGEE
jgi:hypothetical protein